MRICAKYPPYLADGGEMVLDLLRANLPRTSAEAAASILAASRIGGERAPRLIAEILARHAQPPDPRVDRAVIDAWRFFKPDQYAREVLARSWPPERQLPVPDLALANELHIFGELTAIKCELKNYRTGISNVDLSPLTRNSKLRSVTLVGCEAELDLTPLLQLPELETIELKSAYQPPQLAALASIPRPWTLTLTCRACGSGLHALADFQALTRLTLRGGDDLSDLRPLPRRPEMLEALSLYGFPALTSLDGIEQWNGLQVLELFECPQITDLTPLASVTSLERISLGLFSQSPADYRPLSKLPQLQELSLVGNNEFDVTGLAGLPDLSLRVPAKARLIGAHDLSPGTRVTEYRADDSGRGS